MVIYINFIKKVKINLSGDVSITINLNLVHVLHQHKIKQVSLIVNDFIIEYKIIFNTTHLEI
jgi:hypothetical protein